MTKWEYWCEDIGRRLERFNELGAQGWELVSTLPDGDAFFKRPVADEPKPTKQFDFEEDPLIRMAGLSKSGGLYKDPT